MKAPNSRAKQGGVADQQINNRKGTAVSAAQVLTDRQQRTGSVTDIPAESCQENGTIMQKPESRQKNTSATQAANGQQKSITKPQMDGLQAELKRTGVSMEEVKDRYEIQNPEKMSQDLYRRVMMALSKTKSAGAA